MTLTVKAKYLIFPVNTRMPHKRLRFFDGDKIVYALNIRLDNINPDFYAHIEMTPFIGKKLRLDVLPEMEITFRESDTMDIPNLYHEKLRPKVHFSAKQGWINDPNGLFYYDGVYHIFYQFNPAEPDWENMHWGHAVSTDLLCWEQLDTALYPDNMGEMFSGCAFVDKKNTLGLSKDGNDAILLYYTAFGWGSVDWEHSLRNTQCLAISTDGGKTYEKYDGNPIVPTFAPQARDPKVIHCDELDCYIMALYTEAHEKGDYSLLRSDDLIHWERFYDYHIEGEWEFPDIMVFKGKDGRNKYVLTSNTDCYIVLEVRDGNFVRVQNPRKCFHCSWNHSPLSFDNIPDGRCIRMIWEKFNSPLVREGFNGQLTSLEYEFEEIDGVYYLSAKPVRETEGLVCGRISENAVTVGRTPCVYPLENKPYLLKFKGGRSEDAVVNLTFFGLELCIDFAKNLITFCGEKDKYCPINAVGEGLDLQILVDSCGFEVFSDGGKSCFYCITGRAFPDYNLPTLGISSDGEYKFDSIEINALSSIWEK
ncbi:MAG: hypothetical protein IKU43_07240 [Clostridia bacterium]|nr:hypothetical protein [Clostridia bacterium]